VSKRSKEQPPLDSPGWLPLADAHRLRLQQTGNSKLASLDLTSAMASGRVLSMRRRLLHGSTPGPDIGLVPASFWVNDCLVETRRFEGEKEEVFIRSREDVACVTARGHGQIIPITDFAYFVWRQDVEKLWSISGPPDHRQPGEPPQRRRGPVLNEAWFTICGEIARRCFDKKTGQLRVPENENALARGRA
jgi:hypothetical protein